MAFSAGAIVSQLTLDRSKFSAAMKQVSGQVKGFSAVVKQNSAQIKKMGRQMAVVGGAIVGAMGLMVKAYGSFDEAMVRSLAIMGDVSPAMRKEMAKTAKELSTKSTFAAKDLAEAYFFLASAGMNAEQSIAALPAVSRFAQAGTFDLALATDLLTDAQTAMGLSSKDVEENQRNLLTVSDILVKANTLANATVQQFSEALTNRAAPALRAVRKSMEEGVAVLAAYADQGIKGRKAGMQLGMMLNALDIAARDNKEEWEKHGLALFNDQGEMRHMGDLIADVEVLLGDMSTEQRGVTLAELGFTAETKNSILALMGMSEKIKLYSKDLKIAGGITKEVADKQLEAFNAKMTVLKNTVIKAAIGIGQSLVPMIISLGEKIKNIAEKISAWIEKHPKLTAVIATVVTGIGALLLVLGPLMMMLPGIIVALPLIAAGFTAMLGPIGLVIIALTALAGWTNHVINLSKKRMDKEMDAMVNTAKGHAVMWALRKKLIANEVITVEEWGEIYEKHGRSHKRVMIAMAKSPEYAHIREQWDKVIEKEKEAGKSDTELGGIIQKNSEETAKLVIKMIDEVMKATLNEFEYRKWTAQQTYEERKALLETEKADKEAFLLLERTLALELDEIEKDKTQKFKDAWKEKGRAVMAGLSKWYAKEKATRDKIQTLHAGYTNIVKQLTLSEKDYKLWALDKWYAGEVEKLGTNLETKAILEEAYALKKAEIDAGTATSQMSMFEKIGAAATIALGQSKAGAVAQAIMSTYAGAAKTLEMLGMPLAIPFIAMAIIQGFKQVAAIMAVPVPSMAEGGIVERAGIFRLHAGEEVVPAQQVVAAPAVAAPAVGSRSAVTYNITFRIQALDRVDVDRWFRDVGAKQIEEIFRRNQGGITEKAEGYLLQYRR